jgi:membrane protein DedA with SNARE-associated domain/rhodanese-related sulfurtransferase
MSVALWLCVSASMLGDGIWFIAGRRFGGRILALLCRISLSPDTCVRQSEDLVGRWGGVSLVAAKFLPGISVVASPISGSLGMPIRTFLAFELAGSIVWALVFLGFGYMFASEIDFVLLTLQRLGNLALALLGIALVAFLGFRVLRRRSVAAGSTMERIEVSELRGLIDSGHQPVVIDVRSRVGTELDERSIPGAIHIPLDEIDGRALSLPRDREIVVVCSCPNEVSALAAARTLLGHGLPRVRPLAGGFEAWHVAQRGSVL